MNTAGLPADLQGYSDSEIKRLLNLPLEFASKHPEEPFNDCPFDEVNGKYFYFCDIKAEAKKRKLK